MATILALAKDPSWQGVGDDAASQFWHWAGMGSSVLFLAILLFLLGKAARRRGAYRAVGVLGDDDLKQIHEAIQAAEKRTVGEIVPVVLERSDRHTGGVWLAALSTLFAGSLLLILQLPWHEPMLVIGIQFLFGLLGYGAARAFPDFKRNFIGEARATEMAQEQALQEFFNLELHRTEAATGVLLFVSLLERRVIVLGDSGINDKIEEGQWQATDKAILEGIRGGSLRAGLIAGIQQCADLLAEHFPWQEGDRNEIPDRVIVRRE